MVLFINGKKVDFHKADLSSLLKLSLVVEEAKKFQNMTREIIETENHTLYINQCEMAEVSYNDLGVKFLGTDDLTTCQFVILNCQELETVIGAHLDGSSTEVFLKESINILYEKIINRNKQINNICEKIDNPLILTISVFMFGGFCDDSEYSELLTTEFIKQISERFDFVHFNLDLCCVCTLNNKIDNDFNYPIHQGAIFNIEKQQLLPAKFGVQSRGPLLVLRNTRFNADPDIYKIYNSKVGCLEIFPFDYKAKNRQKYYKSLSTSSDFMLRRFSTSPRQEQLGFENNIREVFTLMSEHPDPIKTLFKSRHRPIRFECDKVSGIWKQI